MILNAAGKVINLTEPQIMGILNVSPDSFYDGGKFDKVDDAVSHIDTMISKGLDILDIGGFSSRPGAIEISQAEEMDRVKNVLKLARTEFPDLAISIDTYRSQVAKMALHEGAHIINDITAGTADPDILRVVAENQASYIMMHMQGSPQTMQNQPHYHKVIPEVIQFLLARIRKAKEAGIKDIIVDPGFGFGKTVEHNYEILANLDIFSILDCPILVGISRKSMIQKVLDITADKALNGTTAAHLYALMQGAKILRVHDVNEAKEAVKIYKKIMASS